MCAFIQEYFFPTEPKSPPPPNFKDKVMGIVPFVATLLKGRFFVFSQ